MLSDTTRSREKIMPSTPARIVRIGPHEVANDRPFLLIAGPCQIESRDHAMEMADALKDLKASNTSLGQVAIKEIELLQNAAAAIAQTMSPELFRTQLAKLKDDTLRTRNRLLQLELDRKRGLQEPGVEYYKLGGQSLDVLNTQAAANVAQEDAMKALQAVGFKPKR